MEIYKLPQLKNKNFLESQIRQFTTVKNIIDQIEEENFNKFNQIEVIKKTNIIEKKKQNYSNNNSRLFSIKNYLYKSDPKVIKKIENQLIKNKLKRDKKPTLIYEIKKNLRGDILSPFSPLNERYKLLISNIDYNKRCFRNLSNRDFDSIFNDNNSSINQEPIKNKKTPSSKLKIIKKINYKKNKEIKKRNRFFINGTLTVPYKYNSRNNIFVNRINNIKSNNLRNSSDNKNNINSTLFTNNENNSIMKINHKFNSNYINQFNNDKKYEKFVLLLKKQNDKNMKLLNDVKKQETLNKDSLLVSLVRLNSHKSKKFAYL